MRIHFKHWLRDCADPRAIFSLALVGVVTITAADIVDITWDANGRFERKLTVAPGNFAELCGHLPAGAKVEWVFRASTPLDFNVHYHVGKEVIFPSKLAAVAVAKDTLHIEIKQEYCRMWTNKSAAAAKLTVKLQR